MQGPKTALVTGAARRIGRTIAIDLARHGWAVAIHFNQAEDDATAAVAEATDAGGTAIAVAADLEDETQVEGLLPQVTDALGPVGLLVNNAARFEHDDIHTVDRESWDHHLAINLRAPLILSQAMARALPDDQEGVIVNMLDQRVWNLTDRFLSYTVSKSALWTLTRTLALGLAPRIRVNAIGPGPTMPNTRQTEAQFQRQAESTPLRRAVAVEDITAAVRFIVDTPSMTGQMIALDSGQHLGRPQPEGGDVAPE
ncbi:MAG: SDR family oxidoreductase [Alphaproteobacteria bacterium]|nr:SDR family oxidoreductase [Alphaproteobacteria bacterium]